MNSVDNGKLAVEAGANQSQPPRKISKKKHSKPRNKLKT